MRFAVNSNLTKSERDAILEVFAPIRDELGMWDWRSTKRKKSKNVV